MRRREWIALAGLTLLGCGANPSRAALSAAGVRTFVAHPTGTYRFVSPTGVQFELAGIPEVRTERIGARRDLSREDYELRTDMNSRGFRLTLIDARADRRELPSILEGFEASVASGDAQVVEERDVVHLGAPARELVVAYVTRNQHQMIVRIFEIDGVAVAASAIVATGAGAPTDVDQFFASIRPEP